MKKDILIIGKPNASKSVFLTQLYTRLEKRQNVLKLEKSVSNISIISKGRIALANGESPEATSTDKHGKLEVSVKYNEEIINLYVPDYGGEQLNEIITTRNISDIWKDSIEASNNWILFIRLANIESRFDLSNKTISEEHIKKEAPDNTVAEYSLSQQSSFIELMQIFLHIKKHNYHLLCNHTKLTIVLTCWDELDLENERIPEKILESRLPLFLGFIKSNFKYDYYKVLGLSAQGFTLNNNENKEKYQIEGPESFGYYINENGDKSDDITEVIIQAL